MKEITLFQAKRQSSPRKQSINVSELNTPTVSLHLEYSNVSKLPKDQQRPSKFLQFTKESQRMLGLEESSYDKLAIQCGYLENENKVFTVLYATDEERFNYVNDKKVSTSFASATFNFKNKRAKNSNLYDIILATVTNTEMLEDKSRVYELGESVRFVDPKGKTRVGYVLSQYKAKEILELASVAAIESNDLIQPIVGDVNAELI